MKATTSDTVSLTLLVVMVVVGMGVGLAGRLLLLQELLVGDGWQGGSLVHDGCLIDLFVDRNGLVDGGGLDGLSLNDRLN